MEETNTSLNIEIASSNEYSIFGSESTSEKIEVSIFDRFINFIINFFCSPKKSEIFNDVKLLPITADCKTFEKYVSSLNNDLDQIKSLLENNEVKLGFENPQTKAIDAFVKCMFMENQATAWIDSHKDYSYSGFLPVLEKATRIQELVLQAILEGAHSNYPTPKAPKGNSLVSPGMTNQGNTCYLASLFQGLLGDPVCRQLIIHSLPNDSNDQNVKNFVRVLQECALEFDKAALSGETRPLKFLEKLRQALNPLMRNGLGKGLFAPQQDPSEILLKILEHIQTANNSLFSQQVEHKIYQVDETAKERLAEGTQAFGAFQKALTEMDSKDEASNVQQFTQFLKSIDSKAQIDEKATPLDILRVIVTKLGGDMVTDVSEAEAELLKGKLQEKVASFLDVPQEQGGQWKRTFANEGGQPLFTVTLAGEAKDKAFMSYFEKDYAERIENIHSTYYPGTPFETTVALTQKNTQFTAPPEHLFIQISRHNALGNKITKPINLDETFEIDSQFMQTGQKEKYQIRWFTVHLGGSGGGHYVHYRKCFDGQRENWYLFNDGASPRKVSEVDLKKALGMSTLFFASKVTAEN